MIKSLLSWLNLTILNHSINNNNTLITAIYFSLCFVIGYYSPEVGELFEAVKE
jgi:hypothetical protein